MCYHIHNMGNNIDEKSAEGKEDPSTALGMTEKDDGKTEKDDGKTEINNVATENNVGKADLNKAETDGNTTENNAAMTETDEGPTDTGKGKAFLKCLKKFANRYFIVAFSGMANGLFCTLIAGTIVCQIARIFGNGNSENEILNLCYRFLNGIGTFAKVMMGAGIGVGIAYSLKAPKMALACSVAVGIFSANATAFISCVTGETQLSSSVLIATGNPVTCYLAVVVATELGTFVTGKTKLDILIVPLVSLIAGGSVAAIAGGPVEWLMGKIGDGINAATKLQPFLMGLIISAVMGLLLTLPTSSAAIGVSIGLEGIAAGAGVAGCCAHMIGFAVASYRENKFSGLIAQGLGTSMLQIPNLKNPRILLPAVVSSLVVGPVSTCIFKLEATAVGAGMGTAGLVGVIDMIGASAGIVPTVQLVFGVILVCFLLPATISLAVSELLRKIGWIKPGDMKIEL